MIHNTTGAGSLDSLIEVYGLPCRCLTVPVVRLSTNPPRCPRCKGPLLGDMVDVDEVVGALVRATLANEPDGPQDPEGK